MSRSELQTLVDRSSSAERFFSSYLRHLTTRDDPSVQIGLNIANPEINQGKISRPPATDAAPSHSFHCPRHLAFLISLVKKRRLPVSALAQLPAMPLTSVNLAAEPLSLPPEHREILAKLLLESLAGDTKTDAEIQARLRIRLDDLKSGRDRGLGFEEVFCEKV